MKERVKTVKVSVIKKTSNGLYFVRIYDMQGNVLTSLVVDQVNINDVCSELQLELIVD